MKWFLSADKRELCCESGLLFELQIAENESHFAIRVYGNTGWSVLLGRFKTKEEAEKEFNRLIEEVTPLKIKEIN